MQDSQELPTRKSSEDTIPMKRLNHNKCSVVYFGMFSLEICSVVVCYIKCNQTFRDWRSSPLRNRSQVLLLSVSIIRWKSPTATTAQVAVTVGKAPCQLCRKSKAQVRRSTWNCNEAIMKKIMTM